MILKVAALDVKPNMKIWHFEPLLSNLKGSAPVIVRPGSIVEALAVEQQIPEFDIKRTAQDYETKLAGKTSSILVALIGEKIVGFKVGYERTNEDFYSWLGGVTPEHRNRKIATLLREQQERWAAQKGYKRISVNSYNKFNAMISMLVSSGYLITHFKEHENHFKSRISFTKYLA